jgi:uncharacterized repeat protein (TIGR02543 family)
MYPVVYYIFEQDVTNPDILPQTREYKLGEQVTEATITNPGYIFDGWFDSVKKEPFGFGFTMPDAQAPYVIFGKWIAIVYTVTYNLNNGTNDPDNPEEFTVEDSIPLKSPLRPGFEFEGWDSESVTVSNVGGTVTDLVLTARWNPTKYEITYNLDLEGAVNSFDNLRDYTVETPTFTFKNPTRTGATFEGWVITGTNQPITAINVGSTGALSLTATWTITGYQLSLTSLPGGTPVITTVGEGIAISLPTPTRIGYRLISWTEANQAVWTNGLPMPDKNLSLTANWELVTYSITYNGDSAALPAGLPTAYNYTTNVTIQLPTRTGWTFEGWDYDGDNVADFVNGFNSEIYAENLTLKAIWTQIRYNLVYDTQGGPAIPATTFAFNDSKNLYFPGQESTRPGYSFRGWFEGQYNWSTNPENKTMPSKHINVRAEWTLLSYNVTFSAGLHDTRTYSATSNVENKVPIGFDPVRAGFTFDGWKAQDGITYTADTQMPAYDLVLTAQWR